VVRQVRGTWGTAAPVRLPPGALGGWVQAVSCTAPEECTAGGSYADRGGQQRDFVVSEVHGTWGAARPVPGTAAFAGATVSVLSCASPGSCAAGGSYLGAGNRRRMFVASQAHGTWDPARAVRTAAGDLTFVSQLPGLSAISCASAGDCGAGGEFQVPDPAVPGVSETQAFLISEAHGTWGPAVEVPGTAALNQGGRAAVTAMSCRAAGSCTAAGSYQARGGELHAYVISEADGTWGAARQVPGAAALMGTSGFSTATVYSVSCSSPGNCAAGGFAGLQAFVVSQVNGAWGLARPLTGTGTLRTARLIINTVACGSPGNCSAAGHYLVRTRSGLFVAREVRGRWGQARAVPGPAVLTRHFQADITSVSCDPAGRCSAGGNYPNGQVTPVPHGGYPHLEAFVVSEP
jgi:hypothetical protein